MAQWFINPMPGQYSGSFEYDMIQGITRVETALDGVNSRLDKLNGRVDKHDEKIYNTSIALVTLEDIERRVQNNETQIATHQTTLDQNAGSQSSTGHFWTAIWAAACVGFAEILRWVLGQSRH